jgi:hypothetical protein
MVATRKNLIRVAIWHALGGFISVGSFVVLISVNQKVWYIRYVILVNPSHGLKGSYWRGSFLWLVFCL